jgi:ankyrin repeat protein
MGFTALMHACKEGHEDIVKHLLLREDVDIRLKDKDGKTAYDHCSDWISEEVEARLRSE